MKKELTPTGREAQKALPPEDFERFCKLENSMHESLFQMFKPGVGGFGVSKHEYINERNDALRRDAVAQGVDPESIPRVGSDLLHSDVTLANYKRVCSHFAYYLVTHHPEVNTARYARKKGYDYEYLQYRIALDLSSSTVALDACALAKLYRVHSYDIHDNKPKRITSNNTRSRGYSEARYKHDLDLYGDIAEVARYSGVRRATLRTLKPMHFLENENGKLYLPLDGKENDTKHGKIFDVSDILDKNQDRLREILSQYAPNEVMFPKIPAHLDVHGIRALYAEDLYAAIARNIKDIPANERIPLKKPRYAKNRRKPYASAPAIYRGKKGRKYDRAALSRVSESLGHHRESVTARNYLWRSNAPEISAV